MAELDGFPIYPDAELVLATGPVSDNPQVFIWVTDDDPQMLFEFYSEAIRKIAWGHLIRHDAESVWEFEFEAPFSPRGGCLLKVVPDPEKRRKSMISLVINNSPKEVRLREVNNWNN
jgi:hypothetical protein